MDRPEVEQSKTQAHTGNSMATRIQEEAGRMREQHMGAYSSIAAPAQSTAQDRAAMRQDIVQAARKVQGQVYEIPQSRAGHCDMETTTPTVLPWLGVYSGRQRSFAAAWRRAARHISLPVASLFGLLSSCWI